MNLWTFILIFCRCGISKSLWIAWSTRIWKFEIDSIQWSCDHVVDWILLKIGFTSLGPISLWSDFAKAFLSQIFQKYQDLDRVVRRLLKAKAAVDAQNKQGLGLGGGFGGETTSLMKHGIPLWGSGSNADGLSVSWILFSLLVERLASGLCFRRRDETFSIDDFRLAVFWSDHCNPTFITNFQHCSMDPDVLTFTNPMGWNVCLWRSYMITEYRTMGAASSSNRLICKVF